jgi:hypothetical protein
MSDTEDPKDKIANELEAEMEERDESRLEAERTELEDLNQGMSTGTTDSTRHGVKWGPSYTSSGAAAAPKKVPEDQKDDPDSKA